MANYQLLKADIDEKVYQNGQQEITGANLNSVLNAMVTTLGAEYQFAGVATIDTNPGTPDAKVFYIANGKGTYTNFGGLEVTEDEVVVLYWDTAWHKVATGIASQAKLTELESEIKKKSFSSSTDGEVPFAFREGKTYVIKNLGSLPVNYSTKVTIDGDIVDGLFTIQPNQNKTFVASADANYLRFGAASTGEVYLVDNIIDEIYRIKSNSAIVENDIRKSIIEAFDTQQTFCVKLAGVGENTSFKVIKGHHYVAQSMSWNANIAISIADADDNILQTIGNLPAKGRVSFAAEYNGYFRIGHVSTTVKLYIYEDTITEARFDNLENVPLVNFTYANGLFEESVDISFSAKDPTNSWLTLPDQINTKFDELIASYPNYISKVDAVTGTGLTYPAYTTLNGQASGNYLATPSYTTYLYHLTDESNIYSELVTRRDKILIVAGIHGNETAAIYNAYLFAKHLCEASTEDYFKIRSKFDIYILPIANGYGVYHSLRQNANGVNINRNFPIELWAQGGSAWDSDYTGASAASEFETQLIVALCNKIAPLMVLDHHNYAFTASNIFQYYTEVNEPRLLHLAHQSLIDLSFACIKQLPNYFGVNYQLFRNSAQDAPAQVCSINVGTLCRWSYEYGIPTSATIEICNSINWLNGAKASNGQNINGADTFSVAEYTLRNQIMRFGQNLMTKHKYSK